MITKLYSFYDLPFDHDVCHLFEHIVIQEYLTKLEGRGYNRAFFGWLNGQTIDSSIFFDLGANDTEVVGLFENLLSSGQNINQALISRSIGHIESEMRADITITDNDILDKQLETMATLISQPQARINIPTKSPLKIVNKPRMFREIAIIINVYGISEETRKAFLCFYPAILDIIQDAITTQQAIYPNGISALATKDEGIGIAQRLITRKTVDMSLLEDMVQKHLHSFSLSPYKKHLEAYRQSFTNNPTRNTAPIQLYEQTGIKTTPEELFQLTTPERLSEMLQKIDIQIKPVAGKLKNINWD